MPGDSFPFVVASLAAAILILLTRRSGHHKTLSVVLAGLVVFTTVAIFAFYSWKTGIFNLGTLIAILIGAAFGSFAARFIASLYSSEFGKRDRPVAPWRTTGYG